jgi:hypothetical protein
MRHQAGRSRLGPFAPPGLARSCSAGVRSMPSLDSAAVFEGQDPSASTSNETGRRSSSSCSRVIDSALSAMNCAPEAVDDVRKAFARQAPVPHAGRYSEVPAEVGQAAWPPGIGGPGDAGRGPLAGLEQPTVAQEHRVVDGQALRALDALRRKAAFDRLPEPIRKLAPSGADEKSVAGLRGLPAHRQAHGQAGLGTRQRQPRIEEVVAGLLGQEVHQALPARGVGGRVPLGHGALHQTAERIAKRIEPGRRRRGARFHCRGHRRASVRRSHASGRARGTVTRRFGAEIQWAVELCRRSAAPAAGASLPGDRRIAAAVSRCR